VHTSTWGSLDAAALAAEHFSKLGRTDARIGIEPAFLPSDAYIALRKALPEARVFDATPTFERMRALKTPEELKKLRKASDLITESMLATIAASGEGSTKAEIIERLRREETNRGLQFEYCLLTLGSSHNRASSEQAWAPGEVLSIDSGGNYHGYIGDLCRMGILGEPDAELEDLLGEVEAVQQAAFSKVRAGTLGGDMITQAESVLKASKVAPYTDFFAHGMGLITHEAPFLMTNHPVTYEGTYAAKPLEKNMVLSVETTMLHPTRGFIKLEDTLAVTDTGYVMFGDRARGWNRGGTA
jgi:Xaa-Pro aminopeptidase